MKRGGSMRHRYRRLIGRNIAAELDAELRFHFDMRVEELMARGMDRDAAREAVLSDQLWRHAFGGDTAIIGRTVLFDGVPHTVVGVMPAQSTTSHRAQYWVPIRMPASEEDGSIFFYQVIGRLAGTTTPGALADLASIARAENAGKGPDAAKMKPLLMTLRERRLGDTSNTLLILLAAVGVLMLIACVNVSNLLLARAASRRRELTVRVALGASSWRLARFLLGEGFVLSIAGAGLGLAIAWASVGYFARIGPATVSQAEGLGLDWRVIAFTTALALFTGLVFGLLPAWTATREDVSASISASGGGRNAGSARQNRVRRALVVLELSTALVLVTAAGLLSKSFFRVTSTASGVEPSHLLVANTELSRSRYPHGTAGPFYERLLAAVRATPGVVSASITQAPPIGGARMSMTTTFADGSKSPRFWAFAVDEAYFRTAGIPIVAGRGFLPSDARSKAAVAVVSESMARAIAGKIGSSVIGSVLPARGERGPTIIGIARDVRQRGLEVEPTMQLYTSVAHDGADNYMTLLVRTSGDPAAMVGAVRTIFHRIDDRQPIPAIETQEQRMAQSVAPRRFRFIVLGLFAVLAATLAAVGLYGEMSYVVTERTSEIGVRVALGADRSRVMRLVVGEGMAMTAVAGVLGLAGSFVAVRALRSMVFQVSVYDPWIFATSALVLGVVAIVACGFPAWRAAKVDPITALRAG
jgi:putative ABC transport system permease protein